MSHGAPSWWTEERVALLRTLWAEGRGASEIARRLETSKNAVIGKAHRLKLPARPSPIGVCGPAHPGFRGGRKPKPRPAMAAAVPRLAPPPPAPVAPPRPSGRTCQWIYGEPAGKATRFCDAPGLRGSAYCAAHHALCHTTPAYWLAA